MEGYETVIGSGSCCLICPWLLSNRSLHWFQTQRNNSKIGHEKKKSVRKKGRNQLQMIGHSKRK
jgi:hypothetical protein